MLRELLKLIYFQFLSARLEDDGRNPWNGQKKRRIELSLKNTQKVANGAA